MPLIRTYQRPCQSSCQWSMTRATLGLERMLRTRLRLVTAVRLGFWSRML